MRIANKTCKLFIFCLTKILLLFSILLNCHASSAKPTIQPLVFNQDYGAIPATAANDPVVNGYYSSQNLCGQPSVVEFFSYGCPGCYSIEKTFQKWLKNKPNNVSFKRIPVIFHPGWDQLAKIYYINEAYGVANDLHASVFNCFQNELDHNKGLTDETLRNFINNELANNQNIKGKFKIDQYMKEYKSYALNSKIKNGMKIFSSYGLTSTPCIVVNNKYTITLDQSSKDAYKKMIDTIDALLIDGSATSCSNNQNSARA